MREVEEREAVKSAAEHTMREAEVALVRAVSDAFAVRNACENPNDVRARTDCGDAVRKARADFRRIRDSLAAVLGPE